MASHRRVQRLNQLLREELSRLIRRELEDPRVEMVTVTDVDVSGDLRHAKVFVRTLRDLAPRPGPAETEAEAAGAADDGEADAAPAGGGDDEPEGDAGEDDTEEADDAEGSDALREALEGLRSAEGFLRGTLGRELHIRRIPELHFRADRTLERARRIEELLDRIGTPGEGDDGGA